MAQGKPPLGTVIEMQDGTHHIFNGKGFVPARQNGSSWAVDNDALTSMGLDGKPPGAPSLTDAEGKAQGWARSMANAESSYQRAVADGYNPSSWKNALAGTVEGLPWSAGENLAAGIRDDLSDRGHQAELQWTDAQLRAQSGANAPDPEVKKYVRTYFPGVGENVQKIAPQKEEARVVSYDAAKGRAGPAAEAVRGYGQGKPKPDGFSKSLPPAQLEAAMKYKGSRSPAGTARNPSLPMDADEYGALPAGTYYIHPSGALKRKP